MFLETWTLITSLKMADRRSWMSYRRDLSEVLQVGQLKIENWKVRPKIENAQPNNTVSNYLKKAEDIRGWLGKGKQYQQYFVKGMSSPKEKFRRRNEQQLYPGREVFRQLLWAIFITHTMPTTANWVKSSIARHKQCLVCSAAGKATRDVLAKKYRNI